MRRIFAYLKPYAGRMALGFAIKFVGTVMDLALPWILAHMIDVVVPAGERTQIFIWGALMALCAGIALAGNVIANRRASAVARDVTRTLRHDLFAKTLRLTSAQLDRVTVPSLISRLTTDTYNVNQTVGRIQRLGVRAPILLLGGVTVTLMQDARLSLVLLAVLPLMAAGIALISRRGIPMYVRSERAADRMVRTVRDDARGIRVIRALSREEWECRRFASDSGALSREQLRADSVMAVTNPLMNLLLNGGLTAMVLAGAWWVHKGLSKPGTIIAFLTYFTIILNAVLSINRMFIMISKTAVSARRIDEVLSLPEEPAARPADGTFSGAHIAFEEVSFSYNGRRQDLDGISFALGRGRTLGVIGATGSGKTTLVQLLERFYRPGSGRILISGEDIAAMDETKLRSLFGTAFQSDAFFEGTIRDNIDLGRGLPAEDLERAARAAQAWGFISERPGGWEAPVQSRAANLSGGQRQRLLIARALAGDPEVLVLDDSFSALDYRTDAAVRAAIRQEYPSVTTIMVAQRVSSVRGADLILVLDAGMAVGLGDHETLLRDCPLYAQLSRIQSGGDSLGQTA